jgi:hypothetical protein
VSSDSVIGPSVPRTFITLLLADLGIAAGLFLACGLNWLTILLWAAAVVCSAVLFVISVVRGLPAVEVGPEGFTARHALGTRSFRWGDIEGDFVTVRVGPSKMVAFRLTPAYKASGAKLGRPPCPGYDAAIAGHYRLPLEELAGLLNRHRQKSLAGGTRPEGNCLAGQSRCTLLKKRVFLTLHGDRGLTVTTSTAQFSVPHRFSRRKP